MVCSRTSQDETRRLPWLLLSQASDLVCAKAVAAARAINTNFIDSPLPDRLRNLVSVMVTSVEPLHAVEVRVLGALIEKDITTPEYYPLTVNSLQNACNQKSSRDPVVQFEERTGEQALETLKNKHLVIRISGAGHRVEKFGHRLGETLNLGRREMALLCVLMLRGPQTVGELRGRTERMHGFNDLDEVERVLETLEKSELGVPGPVGAVTRR